MQWCANETDSVCGSSKWVTIMEGHMALLVSHQSNKLKHSPPAFHFTPRLPLPSQLWVCMWSIQGHDCSPPVCIQTSPPALVHAGTCWFGVHTALLNLIPGKALSSVGNNWAAQRLRLVAVCSQSHRHPANPF